MVNKFGRYFAHRLSSAIEWRVRGALESEREATVDLGNIFLRTSLELTDRQHVLEAKIAELEKDIAKLKEDN
jgi:ribosome-associated translation inhibitor RaiA